MKFKIFILVVLGLYISLILLITLSTVVLSKASSEDSDSSSVIVESTDGFNLPMTKGTVTSLFGYRSLGDFHTGIDLSSGTNSNIYAVAAGTVAYTVYDGCGGNTIVIYHNIDGKKYTSYYGHLLKMNVSAGDVVTNNTVIGIEGRTGNCTTGVHLHLEIYDGHLKKDYSHKEGYQHLLNPINFFEGLKEGGYFERK